MLRDGEDITLIANGIMVAEALKAAQTLAEQGVNTAVIDMFTLKPIDRDLVQKYAEKTERIVTCDGFCGGRGAG